MNGPLLYLASTSPRRRQILSELDIAHTAIHPGVDDAALSPGRACPAAWWPAALAYLKARAGREQLRAGGVNDALVIGADTIVLKGGEIIGQPRDAADARRIIERLRNGSHEVITGVALLHAGRRDLFLDAARVTVGDIPDATIDEYIASGGWRGKAGAYNLSERLAAGWAITFDGDACTVMGLPAKLLPARLARFLGYG